MRGRLFLGTSGFAYPEWKGSFYPPDVRGDQMLAHYARQFPSVEINYTFQRTPSERTLMKWIADTPEPFTFSLKAHRRITHDRRLSDVAEPLQAFLASVQPLGDRLGPVLFQCPPTLKADLERLRAFLSLLPDAGRYALEFRHETWKVEQVKSLLAERGVAWCVADTDEADEPLERTTVGFAYLRLRKSVYEDEAIADWAKAIDSAMDDGADVYCYLKHTDEGRGVDYARALRDMVARDGDWAAPTGEGGL